MANPLSFKNLGKNSTNKFIIAGIAVVLLLIAASILLPDFQSVRSGGKHLAAVVAGTSSSSIPLTVPEVTTHVATPKAVKALYMSSWVAGSPNIRTHVVGLLDSTEANSIVIDIKDYSGMVSFVTKDESLNAIGCTEKRISDIGPFIKMLHEKGVYVIGRLAVFQDPCFVKLHPEAAVKRSSDGGIWKDKKGISWMDAGSKQVWDHTIQIAKASYDMGFDEINFDYIRFPTDGNMKDILFPSSGTRAKSLVIGDFFRYIDKNLRGGQASTSSDPAFDTLYKSYTATSTADATAALHMNSTFAGAGATSTEGNGRLTLSADLFGLVTVASDDLGIGQTLDQTLPYVDYISPMVYPSHFGNGWNGFKNPADHPYDVIKISMAGGIAKAESKGLNIQKLRPWLQDFNLKATYTPDMVRAQMQATYDDGLTSWLLWDPNNRYSASALHSE